MIDVTKPKTWHHNNIEGWGATYAITSTEDHSIDNPHPHRESEVEYTHDWDVAEATARAKGCFVYLIKSGTCCRLEDPPIIRPDDKLGAGTTALFACDKCGVRHRLWNRKLGVFQVGQVIEVACNAECGSEALRFSRYI